MDEKLTQEAILLYDRFTHDGLDRRVFMTRMVALAGSVAAAEALIGAIAASPAAAAIVPADDPRLTTRTHELVGGYKAYVAEPRTRSLKATVARHPRELRPQRAYARRRPAGRLLRASAQ